MNSIDVKLKNETAAYCRNLTCRKDVKRTGTLYETLSHFGEQWL